jgi:hypothetical protein
MTNRPIWLLVGSAGLLVGFLVVYALQPFRATADPTSHAVTGAAPVPPAAATGNFFDPLYRVSGAVPDGWVLRDTSRWGTQETTLFFKDTAHPEGNPSIYYRMFDTPMTLAPGKIDAWLREQAVNKAASRVGGLPDYANEPAMTSRSIGGRPALTWTANFTRNGVPWGEYMTRIYSPNGTVLFFMMAPKADLPAMIPKYETIIRSTVMP